MLIQFGHNDMPGKGPERETDPKTTYRENLSRFVDEARAAGAQPILVTSIPRRNFRDGKRDHTHLAPPGQKLTARLLIAELQQVVPELAPVFRTEK
jgi:lysophospholipase L1-like esterase